MHVAKSDKSLFTFNLLKIATLSQYIACEATFYDNIFEHKYWNRMNDYEYKFDPTESQKEWVRTFIANLDEFNIV